VEAQPRITTPKKIAGRWLASKNQTFKGEEITTITRNTASGTGKPGRASAAGRGGTDASDGADAKGSWKEGTN